MSTESSRMSYPVATAPTTTTRTSSPGPLLLRLGGFSLGGPTHREPGRALKRKGSLQRAFHVPQTLAVGL